MTLRRSASLGADDKPPQNKIRASAVLVVAGSTYALAWFLPVLDGFPGWKAFRVALSPIWPFETYGVEPAYYALLTVSSALTNVVFVALIVDLATRRRLGVRTAVWTLALAVALNLYWLVIVGAGRADLGIGYYLWVCSFLILIVGAWRPPSHPLQR